jgi:hypothetical protein
MQLSKLLIHALIIINSIPTSHQENEAFLEQSYYFTESEIDYGEYINSHQQITIIIQKLINPPKKSNTVISAETLSPWLKSSLQSTLRQLNIFKADFMNTINIYQHQNRSRRDAQLKPEESKFNLISRNTQDLQLHTINKRELSTGHAPFEFLGELESYLMGTPSPSDFREIIHFSHQLLLQGKTTGKILHGILNVQNKFKDIIMTINNSNKEQAELLSNITKFIASNEMKNAANMDITQHVIAVTSCADSILQEGQILLHKIYFTLHAGESRLLSRSAISPEQLTSLFQQTNKHSDLFPPQSANHKYFYENKLTHVMKTKNKISVIVRVPLIDPKEKYLSMETALSEFHHPLTFKKILILNSGFRYLTPADIKLCTNSKSALICHKRKIIIKTAQRGQIFVHDTDLQTIIIHQKTNSTATVICPSSHTILILPSIANITLHPQCQLLHEHFRIWALKNMPLMHIISPSSDVTDLTENLLFLQHHQTAHTQYLTSNFNRTLSSFSKVILNDVNATYVNQASLKNISKDINSNADNLVIYKSEQKEMANDLNTHSYAHISQFSLILICICIVIFLLCKKSGSSKSTCCNFTQEKYKPDSDETSKNKYGEKKGQNENKNCSRETIPAHQRLNELVTELDSKIEVLVQERKNALDIIKIEE